MQNRIAYVQWVSHVFFIERSFFIAHSIQFVHHVPLKQRTTRLININYRMPTYITKALLLYSNLYTLNSLTQAHYLIPLFFSSPFFLIFSNIFFLIKQIALHVNKANRKIRMNKKLCTVPEVYNTIIRYKIKKKCSTSS